MSHPRPYTGIRGENTLSLQEASSVEQIAEIVYQGLPSDHGPARELMRDAILALARVIKGEAPLRKYDDPLPPDLDPAYSIPIQIRRSKFADPFNSWND